PAMSFLTCFWLFPQNEHFRRSPVSPTRATAYRFPSGRLVPRPRTVPGAAPEFPCSCPRRAVPATESAPTAAVSSPCIDNHNAMSARAKSPAPRRGPRRRRGAEPRIHPSEASGGDADSPPPDLVSQLAGGDDLVDHAVLLGLLGGEDLVPLD